MAKHYARQRVSKHANNEQSRDMREIPDNPSRAEQHRRKQGQSKRGHEWRSHVRRPMTTTDREVLGKQQTETRRQSAKALLILLVVLALVAGVAFVVLRFHPFDLLGGVGSSQEGQTQGSSDASGQGSDSSSADANAAGQADSSSETIDTSTIAGKFAAGQISSVRVIGDSITAGYLCDGWDDSSLPSSGVVVYDGPEGTDYETSSEIRDWANDFRAWATSHGVTNFVNAGVSGYRMEYLAEAPSSWLREGADLVVVMLGTNDAVHATQEEFRAYCETALSAAAEKAGTLLVVSPPTNDRTDATNRYGMDEIDQILTEVCAEHGWEHVSLLNAIELGTDDFNPDQVHPTTSGSDKLWASLKDQFGLAD